MRHSCRESRPGSNHGGKVSIAFKKNRIGLDPYVVIKQGT